MQKYFSRFSFSLLIFVVAFAALAKGGNSVWARELVIMAVALAFVLMPWSSLVSKPAALWLLPWLVVTVFIGLQLLGSIDGQGFKTSMPLQTVAYWAIFSAYWALAWLVSGLSIIDMRRLVAVLVALACFQAMYGLVAFIGGQETIMGIWEKEIYLQDATGSFVNRNHFAGYLALLWGIGLSYFFSYENKHGSRAAIGLRIGLALIFSMVLTIAILGSHSRLGMVAGLLSVVLWIYLYVTRGHTVSKWSKPILVGMVLAVLFGLVWFGMGKLISRFSLLGLDTRYLVWEAMSNLPLSSWLFGIGAGSFEDVFGTIVPLNVQGDAVFREAHSDWLEFMLDFGLIGTAFIAAALVFWFIKTRPTRWSLIQYGALCGMAAIAIHSLGDFNLQIPGVAVTFWVAVGLLMNPNVSQKAVDKRRREMSRSGRQRRVQRF